MKQIHILLLIAACNVTIVHAGQKATTEAPSQIIVGPIVGTAFVARNNNQELQAIHDAVKKLKRSLLSIESIVICLDISLFTQNQICGIVSAAKESLKEISEQTTAIQKSKTE